MDRGRISLLYLNILLLLCQSAKRVESFLSSVKGLEKCSFRKTRDCNHIKVLCSPADGVNVSAAVRDKDEHVRLMDRNLERCSGKGIYHRMYGDISKKEGWEEDIHKNSRWVLISHNNLSDPIFTYGNEAGLQQFEMEWDDFTSIPSRFSAEPMEREERDALLESVRNHGFSESPNNIRVTKNKQRFQIKSLICKYSYNRSLLFLIHNLYFSSNELTFPVPILVWNLYDDKGDYYGQACIFDREICIPL